MEKDTGQNEGGHTMSNEAVMESAEFINPCEHSGYVFLCSNCIRERLKRHTSKIRSEAVNGERERCAKIAHLHLCFNIENEIRGKGE